MKLTAAEQRIVDGLAAGLVVRRTGHTQYALHRPSEAYKSEGPPFRAATLSSLYAKRPDLDPRYQGMPLASCACSTDPVTKNVRALGCPVHMPHTKPLTREEPRDA